jgi:SAM-dependent methyltransferase
MHYDLGGGIVVRSENAAKPASQGSAFLRNLLRGLPAVESSFDYGCGKLRYSDELLERSDSLALVDSEIQLSREQILHAERTSVRAIARGSNRLRAYNDAEFANLVDRFERGFCINVLSVIPFYSKRRQVLSIIRSRLRPSGRCLFVVQYRNSDFTRMRKMKNARRWRDGFLVDSLRGYSFYGLISPDRLVAMLQRGEFDIESVQLNEGSAYVWASPKGQ